MNVFTGRLWLVLCALLATQQSEAAGPIRIHPENPHYLLFRGKPTVLVTSAEHYGAALNPDFDYHTYLETLEGAGMNLTRCVNGNYIEGPNTTMIPWADIQNTLCPRPGRYLAPWARSDVPGYFNGGNKFDLTRWNEDYFRRLKDYVREAGRRGVVVEMNMNYVMYGFHRAGWQLSPMNAMNNVNQVGSVRHTFVNTLLDSSIVGVQEALMRRTVRELNEFDNVYYEICDEPYYSGAPGYLTDAWQRRLSEVLIETEKHLPNRHMIAWNYGAYTFRVEKVEPYVSVVNLHYAYPPDSAGLNYGLNRPLAFDETQEGNFTRDRRREAWAFLLAGGAVYNNLDWSFALDDATGSGKVLQPGGRFDGRELRRQLGTLRRFMESLDFIRMKPDPTLLRSVSDPKVKYWALAQSSRQYAVYLLGGSGGRLELEIPSGRYVVEWWNPRTGAVEGKREVAHRGGALILDSPRYSEDLALRVEAAAR